MTITDRLKDFAPVPPDAMASSPGTPDDEPRLHPFRSGDVVQLKSGSRPMSVLNTYARGPDRFEVWVAWEHNGEIRDRSLPEGVLRPWVEDTRPEPKGYASIDEIKLGHCVHLVTGISPRMCVYEIDATTGVAKTEWFEERTLKRGAFYYWQLYLSTWTPKAK